MDTDTNNSITVRETQNAMMKNEKIGIATFHCAENYGAYLQAFALQQWLQRRFGVEKEIKIINYRPSYLIYPYKIRIQGRVERNASFVNKCKSTIAFLVELPYRLIKKMRYKKAERLLFLTDPIYCNKVSLDASYKAIILGSDQIWNIDLTKGADRVYFGAIAPVDCKKIAYAVSVGVSEYSPEICAEIKMFLSQLDSIGLREKDSIRILRPLCDSPMVMNIDPTMLVSPDFWKDYVQKVKYKDYILVYQVSTDTRIMQDAYRIAKKSKKKILHFGDPSIKPIFPDVVVKSISYCGPFEFISYIFGAAVILTDSFHATCFSIIFNKKFYVYLQLSRSERLRTLSDIGDFADKTLEYGQILNDWQIDHIFDPLKVEYRKKFSLLRIQSEEYLTNALEGTNNGSI